MEVFWLSPVAWWGLATIAIPIAIHLLTRQHTRRVPFPTLRFLHTTQLVALRRRSIHDWPLLLVRAAILLAAVAALAAPVVVSKARKADWQSRMIRAYVRAPSQCDYADQPGHSAEMRANLASIVLRPDKRLADGLREAAEWMRNQPAAAREVVIVADLREGALSEADLTLIPPTTGIRFEPVSDACLPTSIIESPLSTTTLAADRTHVVYRNTAAAVQPITVRTAAQDTAFAQAALDAVLARGVRVDRSGSRHVLVVFDGGDLSDVRITEPARHEWMRDALAHLPGLSGGQHGDLLVVRVPHRAEGIEAAHVIDRVARAAFADDLHIFESRRVPVDMLAAWSRPPRLDEHAPLSDEGDRRWLWAVALALLAAEWWLRRSAPSAVPEQQILEEPRVA